MIATGADAPGGAVGDRRLLAAATRTPRASSPSTPAAPQSLAQTIQKHKLRDKGVKGGGYDLTPNTQKLLAADQIDFTIDQQPYLQGFLPILQLYLYQASGTLSGIADVNTGLKFLDKTTVVPYNSTKSRLRGHVDRRPA